MDGNFDLGIFIVGGLLFFVLPFFLLIGIINFFISKRLTKKGQHKTKFYWAKLIGLTLLALIIGLFLYDGYYKLSV